MEEMFPAPNQSSQVGTEDFPTALKQPPSLYRKSQIALNSTQSLPKSGPEEPPGCRHTELLSPFALAKPGLLMACASKCQAQRSHDRAPETCLSASEEDTPYCPSRQEGGCNRTVGVSPPACFLPPCCVHLADELIREVTINCAERGLLLLRVRDEIRMTIAAYQTLYESSVAFGMRKALQAEQGKSDMERKVSGFTRRPPSLCDSAHLGATACHASTQLWPPRVLSRHLSKDPLVQCHGRSWGDTTVSPWTSPASHWPPTGWQYRPWQCPGSDSCVPGPLHPGTHTAPSTC